MRSTREYYAYICVHGKWVCALDTGNDTRTDIEYRLE